MDDIIDKVNNPFRKDSWIEQGYSFAPDRQELTPICLSEVLMKLSHLNMKIINSDI